MRTTIEHALVQTLIHGGWTVDLYNGRAIPSEGYMVSYKDGISQDVNKVGLLDKLMNFVKSKEKTLKENGNFLGLWLEDGVVYFDVSRNFKDRGEALSFGLKNKQQAIYNCNTGEVHEIMELTKLN